MAYTVLIVDDSKLARMAVTKALHALHPDWSRLEATNAEQALEQVRQGSVDIAVLDFNMPGRDGLGLAADLRDLGPTMPVAVISANQQDEVVRRVRELGATFLVKPLTEKSLAEFLDSAVHRLKKSES